MLRPLCRCIAGAMAWWLLAVAGCSEPRPNAYQAELRRLDEQIAAARSAVERAPRAVEPSSRLIYLEYSRAALTGEPHDFSVLRERCSRLLPIVGDQPQMQLLMVKLDYQLHRFAAARERLAGLPPGDPEQRALDADLAVQEGRYQEAREIYEQLLQAPGQVSWDRLARYAHLLVQAGDEARALQLYSQAQELLTAREIRQYAWLEVQLGALAMRRGRFGAALEHYRRADLAYPGYWLVADHIAEVAAARGDVRGAIEQYLRIVAQWPRPDFHRTLGDLYSLQGDAERARHWHGQAEVEYAGSVAHGDVYYLHHLADFHADVTNHGAAAVKWARQDLLLRQHYTAQDALAWALYRNGQLAESLAMSAAALQGGAHDVHVLRHAALIHAAAGRGEEGTRLLQRAAQLNPFADAFHVHR